MRKNRKAVIATIMAIACLFASCAPAQGDSADNTPHTHEFIKLSSRKPTCLKDGRHAYWHCEDCGKYYLDAKATKEVTLEQTVIAKLPHNTVKTEKVEETCNKTGKHEYWTCSDCTHIFADEACTIEVTQADLIIGSHAHTMQHVANVPVNGKENGVKEHWVCSECEGYFADENGFKKLKQEETILYSVMNIPDFLVEVPEGRDPVVLQLTDTQFIDGSQIRPGRTGVSASFHAPNRMDELCFDYLTEVITATNPDLIIMTGDNVYGEFDDNGTVLTKLVNFMESFNIPWAPIFGNHDNESKMGVDWQCKQFENAENCLFEQKELTGNGNYSVGIKQGESLTRVFYMLDSNGCGNASDESLVNGHTKKDFTGFGKDQIEWYTGQINSLKDVSPETKISFAYHIQTAIFAEAYKKYGFDQNSEQEMNINIDMMADKTAGDFGYIGNKLKGAWDTNKTVYKSMKELGVDSVFVGHEHENSVSVVYEGIRFQFGQKSSRYDRFNYIDANGNIANTTGDHPAGTTPLMGGSVVVLSELDGAIKDAYIYYCGFENGQIDWSQYTK